MLYFLPDVYSEEALDSQIDQLLQYTFAYASFENEQRIYLKEYFKNLAIDIFEEEPDGEKRKLYAKSSLPINCTKELYDFIQDKVDEINNCGDPIALLDFFWQLIFDKGDLKERIEVSDIALQFCKEWVLGRSYVDLINFLNRNNLSIRGLNIDKVVSISENSIGYNLVLIVSAITEILKSMDNIIDEIVVGNMKMLQKFLKYGLNDEVSLIIYEIGFMDRMLSVWIKNHIRNISDISNKSEIILAITEKREEIRQYINENYPSYFIDVFDSVIVK